MKNPDGTALPLPLRAQAATLRALLKLPRPALVALAGGRPVERDGCILDEQIQLMLHAAARLGRGLSVHDDLPRGRRELDLDSQVLAPPSQPMASVEGRPVREGVTARIYRPSGLAPRSPAVLFFHGGGFVRGSLYSHDPVCRALAHRLGCVVVAIDYRLAPEHPFPAAPDDATASFRWLVAQSDALNINASRIAVCGDSAGGNLAAVVCLDTRHDDVRPCFQALVYPVVDNTRSFPSATIMADGFLLTEPLIEWFRKQYTPDPSVWRDPRVSPWFTPDVAGLPPAHLQTAGFDPLRDEGEAYASRLRDAGVPVSVRRYRSLVHGYLNMFGHIEAARPPFEDLVNALREALFSPRHAG